MTDDKQVTRPDSTPATVAVPVELAEAAIAAFEQRGDERANHLRSLLPKPTPRLVVVDAGLLSRADFTGLQGYLDSRADLLTLLDDVLAETVDSLTARLTLRVRIRAALGVSS